MKYDFLTDSKRSLFLIDCRVEGDRLYYGIGVLAPGLRQVERLRTEDNQSVSLVLSQDEVGLKKRIVLFNRSLEING